MTPDLPIYKFSFTLKALEDIQTPPYKGSMFRGAFGWAFRKAVCVTKHPTCQSCLIKDHCNYFKLFETELPTSDIWFLRGVRKVPHPFIINPPLDSSPSWKEDETFEVGLTIFGSAISLFPFFIFTFQVMGERGVGKGRGKFEIAHVDQIHSYDTRQRVFTNGDASVPSSFQPLSPEEDATGKFSKNATLSFLTPVRLQKNGKVFQRKELIDPMLLITALERRYYIMLKLFGEGNPDIDYPRFSAEGINIADNSLYFHRWERYSSRQEKRIDMSGFKGNLTLKGDLTKAMPLLNIGRHLHLGKNTIFGLGRYSLTPAAP